MPKLLLLLVTIMCLFTNCDKDIFDQLEMRLEGTWEFTSASQRDQVAFSGHKSIFSYYENDKITFLEDKTAIYTEANGDQLEGVWSTRSVEATDTDGNTVQKYMITIALVDPTGDLIQ